MNVDELKIAGSVEFSQEFLKQEHTFFAGPWPLVVSVSLNGGLGLKFGFGDIDADNSNREVAGTKVPCDKGRMLAAIPYAKADLSAMGGVTLIVAKAGVQIDVTVVQLSFPYTNEWDVS